MIQTSIENYFREKSAYFETLYRANARRFTLISNLRFLVVLITTVYCLYFSSNSMYGEMFSGFFVGVFSFVGLAIYHSKIEHRKNKAKALLEIHQNGLTRLDNTWDRLSEDGSEFRDSHHRYASDLDLFGKHSLFQFTNHTTTFLGSRRLAERLRSPLEDRELLRRRQASIRELAAKIDWCVEFEAEGRISQAEKKDPSLLIEWAQDRIASLQHKPRYWRPLHYLPLLTLALGISSFFGVPVLILQISLIGQILITLYSFLYLVPFFKPLDQYRKDLQSFSSILRQIEGQTFSTSLLQEIRQDLSNTQLRPASQEIKRLTFLTDLLDVKYNPILHIFLNVFFLWDYQCYGLLVRWREQSGKKIENWLNSIAVFEELSSFAILAFSHPDWCYPDFFESNNQLEAHELGHPLIQVKERVTNDFEMSQEGRIHIVTGSNMSGKSTFLRTIGVNLVLAFSGSPVCARFFSCSLMNISTSMRTQDNLENHISSFYAEVLRIKTILDDATQSGNMIFLIDEIFKGTNSQDRQQGAEAIIRSLNRSNVLGLVSTHDLALGDLANDSHLAVKNFHFTETYSNNEIRFDYRLRSGISKTTNGLYLLKMVGFELEQLDPSVHRNSREQLESWAH